MGVGWGVSDADKLVGTSRLLKILKQWENEKEVTTGRHMQAALHQIKLEHWLEREIAQWVHREGSIRRPIAP